MTNKNARMIATIVCGSLLGVLAIDYGLGELKKHTVPPEEQAAVRKMQEIYRETHGNMDEFTPDQYRMMQEFMRTRRVTERAPLDASMQKMPDEMRLRHIWRVSGGDWKKMSPEDRVFVKSKVGRNPERGPIRKKRLPPSNLPPYASPPDGP